MFSSHKIKKKKKRGKKSLAGGRQNYFCFEIEKKFVELQIIVNYVT